MKEDIEPKLDYTRYPVRLVVEVIPVTLQDSRESMNFTITVHDEMGNFLSSGMCWGPEVGYTVADAVRQALNPVVDAFRAELQILKEARRMAEAKAEVEIEEAEFGHEAATALANNLEAQEVEELRENEAKER